MNPREVLGLRLWLVSHEMSTSGSPTEQFEICVSGAYFRGIWIPECGGHVTDRHTPLTAVMTALCRCAVRRVRVWRALVGFPLERAATIRTFKVRGVRASDFTVSWVIDREDQFDWARKREKGNRRLSSPKTNRRGQATLQRRVQRTDRRNRMSRFCNWTAYAIFLRTQYGTR